MQIANPIYDVVFKYMMDDFKVAKLVLSALTDMEIDELNLMPQEFIASGKIIEGDKNIASRLGLNIYRMDFQAKVKNTAGVQKLIIIEIQKSKIFTTPLRFRSYLGKQLMNAQHYYEVETDGKKYQAGIPIYSIYLLGEEFNDKFVNIPVIKVGLAISDKHNGEVINVNDPFIESLYHQGIIINIPALKQSRRNELELFLSIFNQDKMTNKGHSVMVDEEDIPDKYKPVIDRLARALQNKQVKEYMSIEDDFLAELDQYYVSIEEERRQKEEERRQKEFERSQKEIERSQKEIERSQKEFERSQKDIERNQKEFERSQKEIERSQKEMERRQKEDAILLMLDSGISKAIICEKLRMDISEIEMIIENRSR